MGSPRQRTAESADAEGEKFCQKSFLQSITADLQTPYGLQFCGIGFDAGADASNTSPSAKQDVGCDGGKPLPSI